MIDFNIDLAQVLQGNPLRIAVDPCTMVNCGDFASDGSFPDTLSQGLEFSLEFHLQSTCSKWDEIKHPIVIRLLIADEAGYGKAHGKVVFEPQNPDTQTNLSLTMMPSFARASSFHNNGLLGEEGMPTLYLLLTSDNAPLDPEISFSFSIQAQGSLK